MTDRAKVIKGLECLVTNEVPCDGCPYNKGEYSSCLKEIASDALELLKAQEKVKVVYTMMDTACGNCGCYLDKTYSVCPQCGKELDWNA